MQFAPQTLLPSIQSPPSSPASRRSSPQSPLPVAALPSVSRTPSSPNNIPTSAQLPPFQPAPTQWYPDPSFEQGKKEDTPEFKFDNFAVLCGFILALLALTPMLDSLRLVYSSTVVYFLGRWVFFLNICFSCAVILFLPTVLSIMSRKGKPLSGEKTLMFLVMVVLALLGLGLVVMGESMGGRAGHAYHELMLNCETGLRTQPLTQYYHALLSMRRQPDCINKTSVELCSGFEENPYTNILKSMELNHGCSGFCYKAPAANALSLVQRGSTKDEGVNDFMGLLQAMDLAVVQHNSDSFTMLQISSDAFQQYTMSSNRSDHGPQNHQELRGLFKLASKSPPMWKELPKGRGDTHDNMAASGWMENYPPTLFTGANYKTTCEGAAAREIRWGVEESARFQRYEGSGLLLVSLIAGLLKLCGMCGSKKEPVEQTAVSTPDGQGAKQVVF